MNTNPVQNPSVAATENQPFIAEEQNKQLLQFALSLVAVAVAVKLLAAALFGLPLFAVLILFYACQTVPSNSSFNAKKELKRVLRGDNLPADSPDKPRTWLEQTVANVKATVATEISTSLGYELTLMSLGGFATIACVRVPAAQVDCYWLGAFGRWQYITMKEIQDTKQD